MPQDLPSPDPDSFSFGDDSVEQDSTADNFCKQLGLDYENEHRQEREKFYSDADLGEEREVLRLLKDSTSALTKRQIAAKLYPEIFHNNVERRCDERGEWVECNSK